MPLSQTKMRQGVLAGALLIALEEDGSAPTVRLITSQTVRSGRPSLHSGTRWRANSYSLGPLVPVDTLRQYQCEAGRRTATVATGFGALPSSTTTRFDRDSPLYL